MYPKFISIDLYLKKKKPVIVMKHLYCSCLLICLEILEQIYLQLLFYFSLYNQPNNVFRTMIENWAELKGS